MSVRESLSISNIQEFFKGEFEFLIIGRKGENTRTYHFWKDLKKKKKKKRVFLGILGKYYKLIYFQSWKPL